VNVSATPEEIKEKFLTQMYSRMPVYEKSIDNIIGIVTQKDFFRFYLYEKTDIREILREAMFIYEEKKISEVLAEMQRKKAHFVVVIDQHGGTKGIVTMEDIIEELVGEIYDEDDDETVTRVTPTNEGEYEITGDTNLVEMLEYLGLPEEHIESASNTVGGWVTELAGHIPEVGEEVAFGEITITVLAVAENTVQRIKLVL
jgi:CBS domain containing-hemolysin-like protein